MIISLDFNLTLEEYSKLDRNSHKLILDDCPNCECTAHGNLLRNGSYKRWAIEGANEPKHITIYRYYCKQCDETFSILPNFLIPYFQHTLSTILDIIRNFLQSKEPLAYRQLEWFYVNRYDEYINKIYVFLREINELSGRPSDETKAALLILNKIIDFDLKCFLKSSATHFTKYFLARTSSPKLYFFSP